MKHALDILHQEKYQDVVLWVLAANQQACHFYEKRGFISIKQKAIQIG